MSEGFFSRQGWERQVDHNRPKSVGVLKGPLDVWPSIAGGFLEVPADSCGSRNLIDSDCILYTNSIQILMIPSGPAVDQPR